MYGQAYAAIGIRVDPLSASGNLTSLWLSAGLYARGGIRFEVYHITSPRCCNLHCATGFIAPTPIIPTIHVLRRR
jgi:hypothetical protein